MQLSKSLEQACCVLGIIAEYGGRAVTGAALNRTMDVSPSYLSKITRKLVVAKLIESTQGVNGGYILAKPMDSITLRAVVEAIEGDMTFFRPSGIIERVFVAKRSAAKKGVSLLELAFQDAESVWRRRLETVTMQRVISGALAEK